MQRTVTPAILAGENAFITAGTGSGKTEAAVAPIVSRYWRPVLENDQLMPIVYIVPTKALANDLLKRLERPLDQLHLTVGIRHGDRDDLQHVHSPNVVITTPESLEVLLIRNDAHLVGVRAVIIDEMHLFYNTQRGLQLAVQLRRLVRQIGHPIQVVALSATVGDLKAVRDFLLGPATTAALFRFEAGRPIDAVIRPVASADQLLDLTEHLMSANQGAVKYLTFVDSRVGCEQLIQTIAHRKRLAPLVSAHYSSLSPEVRLETERRFAEQRQGLCISTSTLELGIDIGDIDAIALWEPTRDVNSFLQRVGRGNRRSSKTNVICLVPAPSKAGMPSADWDVSKLPDALLTTLAYATLLHLARRGQLEQTQPFHLYGAVVQQILGLLLETRTWVRTVDLAELLRYLPWLNRITLESMLSELEAQGYIIKHPVKNHWSAGEKLFRLKSLRMIYGNFPIGSREIGVMEGNRKLGDVPDVNLMFFDEGKLVRFNGANWRVVERSDTFIRLEPSTTRARADFRYGGEKARFDQYLIDGMWHSVFDATTCTGDIADLAWRARYEEWMAKLRTSCTPGSIPYYIDAGGMFHYLTCAGRVTNGCLAAYAKLPVDRVSDFGLVAPKALHWSGMPRETAELINYVTPQLDGVAKQTLFQSLLPDRLQIDEAREAWLKAPSTLSILQRLQSGTAVEVSPGLLAPFGV
ncbi:MAG: DEAD/DEAH box helicase [Candidatus Cryosericum sp.]